MSEKITFAEKLAYAAPLTPIYMMMAPALAVLPALYAKHGAVDLKLLGGALFLSRLFDSAIDPAIGYLSDLTRSRLGPRKPWIILGALICAVSCFFWFQPGPSTGVAYFIGWSMAVYLGWSLMEVPHSAWLADLSGDYDERSNLAGFRTAAIFLGSLIFFAVPLLPIFPTTEITPRTLSVISWVIIAMLALTVPWAVFAAPRGAPAAQQRPRLLDALKAVATNKPLGAYVAIILISNISSGMVGSLYYFYMDAYLGIADKIAVVTFFVSIASILSAVLWPLLMRFTGKHDAFIIVGLCTAATLVVMGLLKPGPLAFPIMFAVFCLLSVVSTGVTVAMSAMMADIADYDEWRTHQNRTALFYSFNTLLLKLGVTIGGGLGLLLVGLFGFNANGHNDVRAMTGFFIAFIIIPIILNLGTSLLAWRFPLTRQRHALIRRRLGQRREREAAHAK